VEHFSQKMHLQTAAKPPVLCFQLANTNGESNSAFCQITLVLVYFAGMSKLNTSEIDKLKTN